MAIRNGDLNPSPKQYKLERHGGKVEAGPILADGFLVWLATTRYYPGHTITLKIVDLTRPATDRNLDLEWGDDIEVAEFTCGNDYKIHRNGYDVEWIDLHTLNNMTWRALGCGGGLAAYWIAGEYVYSLSSAAWFPELISIPHSPYITVRDLTQPKSEMICKLSISGLNQASSRTQDRYVNYLLCNKDYIVVNLSRSSTFGVYSVASKTLLHVLDVSPEVPDSLYNVFTGMLSGWRDRTSFALKIQDNFLIIACVLGMFFLLEDTTLRFKSWNLTSPPIYEEPGMMNCSKKDEHEDEEDEEDEDGNNINRPRKYPFSDLQLSENHADTASNPLLDVRDRTPILRPRTFLCPLTEINIPLQLPHDTGLYGPKLLFQPQNTLQLYCQDNQDPNHPTHPHLRWSYLTPPTELIEEELSRCDKFTPSRRGYMKVFKEEGKVFDRFKRRFATDVRISDVRYELTLPPVPVWSGGSSTAWVDQKGWKHAKKCIRLQMTRESSSDVDVGKRHWDAEVEMKRFRRHPHMGHGVNVAAGWEGIAVLWLDRILVWRWDLDEHSIDKFAEIDTRSGKDGKDGLAQRVLSKVKTF